VDRLEARLVAGAEAVTVVSPSWAQDLDRRFQIKSRLHVITNGYDPEDLAGVQPHPFDHFALVYTGIFYPPIRVVTPLLLVLKRLATKNPARRFRFHYYGIHGEHVRSETERLGVGDLVVNHGNVPRPEALSAVKGAGLAVVIGSLGNEAPSEINGWIPAKLYEAIGLGTPVLLIAPAGGDAELIGRPTGLIRRFTGDDIDGMASFIEEMAAGGELKKKDVGSITWQCLADQFDGVLRRNRTPAPVQRAF
jgi:glycosyltransferase involved in cell wall biosynthesis